MKIDNSAHFKQSTTLPWIELRIADRSTACYQAHSHDEFSFGLIQQGHATYQNRGHTHQIGSGDIVTINPADVHSCNPEAGTWSYCMLFVDAFKMGEFQQDILGNDNNAYLNDYVPFLHDLERSEYAQNKFQRLFSALHSESSPLTIQTYLYDFLASSLSKIPIQSKREPLTPSLGRVREKLLDEVKHSIQLEDLAKEVGLSRYQLLRAFKGQYGLPPHAYLMDEKIKRSKRMLKSGLNISEVAYQLGFSDQAHFQRHFKKKLAVTPKFYQSHFINEPAS
ncbi:transcriptional regulator [Vibrio genomosp. F10 str. ZF-129]|uniref:Transcriptional regulator n=1 Tax=Vibrio genomosp. F10 str. ZF-129 TaxID=1187848 RepID=A0A1E5BAD3_9VIBR|nr:AraC family transcriptional regulator [Vibrio genomosp. F10]OEE30781.1 transcriptional regulator [Vibrio genomosp. F10 str. ZF-129]